VKVDIPALIACGVSPTQARIWADPLGQAMERFHIDSKVRIAAFIAQVAHESMNFTHTEENLYYTRPERIHAIWPSRVPTLADATTLARNPRALANRVYANRIGNGDEASGDGWRYRGRGLIQLTGRANYLRAKNALGFDYVANPDLVAQPEHAAITACWFWDDAGGNELADGSQIDALTRRINGPAMEGEIDMMDFLTNWLGHGAAFVGGVVACAVWLKAVPQLTAKIKAKFSRDEE
jgi:putative chitinase